MLGTREPPTEETDMIPFPMEFTVLKRKWRVNWRTKQVNKQREKIAIVRISAVMEIRWLLRQK